MPTVPITSSEQYEKAIEVLTRVGGTWQGVGMEERFLLVSEAQYHALVEAKLTAPTETTRRSKHGKNSRKNAKQEESRNWDQINARRIELAEKSVQKELTPAEAAEFDQLQIDFFQHLETKHPRPPLDMDRLDRIEAELKASNESDGDR